MLVVDYARLTEFQAALRAIHQEIDTTLTDLAARLDTVTAIWEGAASEGFQQTMTSWHHDADDLRDRLAELHNMVGRAHDNQARAVRLAGAEELVSVALAPLEEQSPTRRTLIDVDDFQAAADAFALQQAGVAGIIRTLGNGLDAHSPCIGADRSGTYFGKSYQVAAETVLKGLKALHDVLGPIADGLAKAGTDHSRATAISAGNWTTTDYQTVTPNYDIVGAAPPADKPSPRSPATNPAGCPAN